MREVGAHKVVEQDSVVTVKVGRGALGGRESASSPRDGFSGDFQLFLDFETESEGKRKTLSRWERRSLK